MSSSSDNFLDDSKATVTTNGRFGESMEFALLLKDYKIVFNKATTSSPTSVPPSKPNFEAASISNRLPRRMQDNRQQSSSFLDVSEISQSASTAISIVHETDVDTSEAQQLNRHRQHRHLPHRHHHHHNNHHLLHLAKRHNRHNVPKRHSQQQQSQHRTNITSNMMLVPTEAIMTATTVTPFRAESPSNSSGTSAATSRDCESSSHSSHNGGRSRSERSMRCRLLRKQLELVELQLRHERRVMNEETKPEMHQQPQQNHCRDC